MVQKYLVEEAKELIYDVDKLEEWKIKCEELGLTKQLALTSGDGKSPIPFEHMNTVSERVYRVLCPSHTNYKEYSKTTIPLEVLSLIALAEKEKYFSYIEIWYDDKTPDPLAVGFAKRGEYSHDKYMIAKWADMLPTFDKLLERAKRIYTTTTKLELNKKREKAEFALKNIDTNVAAYFNADGSEWDVMGG